jgi:hypothetical protein
MEADRRNGQKTWRIRITKEIIQNMQVSEINLMENTSVYNLFKYVSVHY